MTPFGNRRKNDRRGGWLILVLLAVFFLPAVPARAGGVLTAGCEYDFPPYCVVDEEGRAGGFSVELFRAALAAMDREVEFRPGYWADLKRKLAAGELDALPLVGRTPERESLFDFTFPYLSLHGAIVIRSGEEGIRNLDDLRGRAVAVMAGDNAEEFLRRTDRGIEILTTPTFTRALEELSAGRHDAVFIQRLVALRLLQKTGIDNLEVIAAPVKEFRQDLCFAVPKGDSETLALLNEGLSVVMADGTFQRLHARWFAALELPHLRSLVFGGDHNYPPFEYLDGDGRPTGFNVDLIRAAVEAAGLEAEIRLGPWAEIRRGLELGEIDAVQGILYSPARARYYDFTPPYLVIHYVAVVRAGEGEPPATVEELAGRRIAVQRGDILDDYLAERGVEAEITRLDSQEDALRELAAGLHDCVLGARLTVLYLSAKHGWENLVAGKQPLLSADYCAAVPRGERALLAQISEGLRAIRESGEYREIRDRWFGIYEEEPLTFGRVLRYSAAVLVPLLLILAAVLLWSWSLRREVKRRTAALAESEQRYRTLFERTPVGIFAVRSTGEPLAVNPALAATFGFPSPEAGMAHYREGGRELYFPPGSRDSFLWQLREYGRVTDFEYRGRRTDGGAVWLSVTARISERLPDGSFVIEGFTIDISERKRAEEELRKRMEELERWHRVTLDREGRTLDLKREVNELLLRLGEKKRYENT